MSLTYVQHCFGPFDGDIIHLNQNKRYKQLVLASSQGDCCIIINAVDKTILAQTPKFQDSVTQALWVSPNYFLVSSLDGSLRLYKYEINENLQEISCLDNLDQLAGFYICGRYVYAYTENCDVYVIKYDNPAAPELIYTVTCNDLKEVQPVENGFVAIGSELIHFNVNTLEEKRIQLNNDIQNQFQPTASYYDDKRKLLFIGYNNGVTEIFLLNNQTYKHAQQLAGITEADVTIIKRVSIMNFNNEQVYYYIGTNDGLYCYESNFQLRNMIHLRDQGVSVIETTFYGSHQSNQARNDVKFGNNDSQLLMCGLADGQLLVVDQLSLQEVCKLDIFDGDIDTDNGDNVKPILGIVHVPECQQCLITGDNYIYVYPDNFNDIGDQQKKEEEEISFKDNERTDEASVE